MNHGNTAKLAVALSFALGLLGCLPREGGSAAFPEAPGAVPHSLGGQPPPTSAAFAHSDLSDADSFSARSKRRPRAPSMPAPWFFPATWSVPAWIPLPQLKVPPKAPAPSVGAPLAIAFAQAQLGKPYCWGGSGPACFDCSGLTQSSWKAGGRAIPRTSEAQVEGLPEVPLDKILPGDILWRPGHVALYIGNAQIIHAPHTGDVIRVAPATRFTKAVRP